MDYRESLKALILSVGTYIADKKTSFTPKELAASIAKHLEKPEEEIINDVIKLCKEMIECGAFWSSESFWIYTNKDSVLTIAHVRPFQSGVKEALHSRAHAH